MTDCASCILEASKGDLLFKVAPEYGWICSIYYKSENCRARYSLRNAVIHVKLDGKIWITISQLKL